ncbi:chloride channel protein [Haematococcus lacustris]|uniref:Chloride channel protein n=1 Tax=Haematococcus lacustris TaxID=44745 RepID=A0A6A0A779_HAELA|nr:chloride channel protein [Haematococcus lacustris]
MYKRMEIEKPTPAVARDGPAKHCHDRQRYDANVRKFRDQGGHQAASNSRASPASLHSGPSGLYVPSLDEPLAPAKHSQYSLTPVKEITEALRGVTHNGFPVVKDSASGQVVVGLITRSHLMALLQRIVLEGRSEGLQVGWSELNRRMMDPVLAQRSVHEQQMVALQREMANSIALADKVKLNNVESIDYLAPNSAIYRNDVVLYCVRLVKRCLLERASFSFRLWAHRTGADGKVSAYQHIGWSRKGLAHGVGGGLSGASRECGPAGSRGSAAGVASGDIDEMSVDLLPYTNTSSFVLPPSPLAAMPDPTGAFTGAEQVPDSFSVERTYILFRTMGLRHLMVIDQHNHVRGIVTRKDLLGFRLDEAIQKTMGLHLGRGGAQRRALGDVSPAEGLTVRVLDQLGMPARAQRRSDL